MNDKADWADRHSGGGGLGAVRNISKSSTKAIWTKRSFPSALLGVKNGVVACILNWKRRGKVAFSDGN